MKKLSIYAITAFSALTVTGAIPFQSFAAPKAIVISGGNSGSCLSAFGISNPDALIPDTSCLDVSCQDSFPWSCIPGLSDLCTSNLCSPDCSQAPGTSTPDRPQTPGTSTPDLPQTPDTDVSSDASVAQVLSLVNEERAKAGLPALSLNTSLSAAASIRAAEIQTSFSHTRPGGKDFSTVLKESGISYRAAGENIAYGQTSAQKVMTDWMNSAGHRANILNTSYTEIGIAHVKNASGTDYWVQLFIR